MSFLLTNGYALNERQRLSGFIDEEGCGLIIASCHAACVWRRKSSQHRIYKYGGRVQ